MIFKATFVAVALALASVACTSSQKQAAKTQVDDALLAASVRIKISTVEYATLSTVRVHVAQGIVTLNGEVKTAQIRKKVEGAARSVDGVKAVIDRIIVNPNAPTGQEIAADVGLQARVEAALAAQTGVNALKLSVSARKGVVTLSGIVPSASIKATALDTVRGVKGVKSVIDHITVQPKM